MPRYTASRRLPREARRGASERRKTDQRYTCPTCKTPEALTTYEVQNGHHCRECTARTEGYGF